LPRDSPLPRSFGPVYMPEARRTLSPFPRPPRTPAIFPWAPFYSSLFPSDDTSPLFFSRVFVRPGYAPRQPPFHVTVPPGTRPYSFPRAVTTRGARPVQIPGRPIYRRKVLSAPGCRLQRPQARHSPSGFPPRRTFSNGQRPDPPPETKGLYTQGIPSGDLYGPTPAFLPP